jgi:hypothetical protein
VDFVIVGKNLIERDSQRRFGTGGEERPEREADLVAGFDAILFECFLVESRGEEGEGILALERGELTDDLVESAIERDAIVLRLAGRGIPG